MLIHIVTIIIVCLDPHEDIHDTSFLIVILELHNMNVNTIFFKQLNLYFKFNVSIIFYYLVNNDILFMWNQENLNTIWKRLWSPIHCTRQTLSSPHLKKTWGIKVLVEKEPNQLPLSLVVCFRLSPPIGL